MIKMYANGVVDGKPIRVVMFGLTHTNLDYLREGRPIKFTGDTCGLTEDIHFLIYAGESELKMQEEIRSLVGPDTVVSIDPRLGK